MWGYVFETQKEKRCWIIASRGGWLIKRLELAKEYGVRKVSVEGWTEAQFQNLLSSSQSLLMDNGHLLEEAHSLCNLFYTHGMA